METHTSPVSPDVEAWCRMVQSRNVTLYKPKKVLVVDDHEPTLELFKTLLQPWNVELLCASNAADAMALIAEHTFSLVIADYRMPVETGLELIRRLYSNKSAARPAAILFSGVVSENLIQEVTRLNRFVAIVPKPMDFSPEYTEDVMRTYGIMQKSEVPTDLKL